MMQTIKLCRDCRHSVVEAGLPELRCVHPNVLGNNPNALASATVRGIYASMERSEPWPFGACGRRGALWEAKS